MPSIEELVVEGSNAKWVALQDSPVFCLRCGDRNRRVAVVATQGNELSLSYGITSHPSGTSSLHRWTFDLWDQTRTLKTTMRGSEDLRAVLQKGMQLPGNPDISLITITVAVRTVLCNRRS
jgi:hypothetical protein